MAEAQKKDDFEFEIEGEDQGKPLENEVEAKEKPEVDIEIEDDTPEEDRGRTPLPKEIVEELEADELEEYSNRAKIRLKQMKRSGTMSVGLKMRPQGSGKRLWPLPKTLLKRISA